MSLTAPRPRPPRTARTLAVATATLLGLGAGLAAATPARAAEPVSIQLLGINDFHGRIWDSQSKTHLAAVLAGKVNQLRAENPNTVFVSSGDSIGASTFESFIADDNPTVDVLNAAGLDVSAVGNHEFDRGFAALLDRLPAQYGGVEDPATDLHKTDFPYLGANVYAKGTQDPLLPEYALLERAGVTVGFVGLVTAETYSLVTPSGIANLDFGDPLDALNRVSARLSDGEAGNGEADVIVALVHDGSSNTDCAAIEAENTQFGELVHGAAAEVDAIFSAHTHQRYNCTIQGRPVIQAGSYATHLGQVVLNIDPENGTVASWSSALIPLAGSAPPEPAVATLVDEAVRAAEVTGSRQVGSIAGDITRATTAAGAEDRGSESSLGSLVADIQLWATSQSPNYAGREPAQIAFMNPGGLRADLRHDGDGEVTYQEVALVQPFANTLVTMDLTGEQIREVLEQQWQPAGASRPLLRLGISEGLSYTYDPSAPRGSHILDITFNRAPLQEDATFRVVVNSFLATGGDNFASFAAGANRTDSGQVDLQAAVDYFQAHPQVAPPAPGRAVPVAIPPASAGDLTEANAGPVETADAARPGDELVVSLGETYASQPVEVWLYSDPVRLYAGPVGQDGTLTLVLPPDTPPGTHRVAVFTNEDVLIGWTALVVADAGAAAVNLAAPTIRGAAVKHAKLTADRGIWWPDDGLAFSYQWQRDGRDIPRATRATYRVAARDVGRSLTVVVTASAPGASDVSATSAAVQAVPKPLASLTPPKILGPARAGRLLVASAGRWTQPGLRFSFQWNRDGKPIKAATRAVYRVAKADRGRSLTLTVTARNGSGETAAATSRAVPVRK